MAPLTEFGKTVTLDVLKNDYDPTRFDHSELRLVAVTPEDGPDWSLAYTESGEVTIRTGETPLLLSYTVRDDAGNTARALISVPVVASIPPVANLECRGAHRSARRRDPDSVLDNDDNSPGRPRSELTLVDVLRGSHAGRPQWLDSEVLYKPGDDGGDGEGGFSYLIQNSRASRQLAGSG